MARATTDDWRRYYEMADERRARQGGDPLRRYLQRCIIRERCLMVGSCLLLIGLVTAFCIVVIC